MRVTSSTKPGSGGSAGGRLRISRSTSPTPNSSGGGSGLSSPKSPQTRDLSSVKVLSNTSHSSPLEASRSSPSEKDTSAFIEPPEVVHSSMLASTSQLSRSMPSSLSHQRQPSASSS